MARQTNSNRSANGQLKSTDEDVSNEEESVGHDGATENQLREEPATEQALVALAMIESLAAVQPTRSNCCSECQRLRAELAELQESHSDSVELVGNLRTGLTAISNKNLALAAQIRVRDAQIRSKKVKCITKLRAEALASRLKNDALQKGTSRSRLLPNKPVSKS